jgi:hypothetical protein
VCKHSIKAGVDHNAEGDEGQKRAEGQPSDCTM